MISTHILVTRRNETKVWKKNIFSPNNTRRTICSKTKKRVYAPSIWWVTCCLWGYMWGWVMRVTRLAPNLLPYIRIKTSWSKERANLVTLSMVMGELMRPWRKRGFLSGMVCGLKTPHTGSNHAEAGGFFFFSFSTWTLALRTCLSIYIKSC